MKKTKPRPNKFASVLENKLLPYAEDMEKVVLGEILLNPKAAFNEIEDLISANVFYYDANKIIYTTAHSMYKNGKPVDIVSLTNELKRNNQLEFVGGPYYMTTLTANVYSVANIKHHAMILVEKYIRREYIQFGRNYSELAFDESNDIFELVVNLQQDLTNLENTVSVDTSENAATTGDQVIQDIVNRQRTEGMRGVSSGFHEIDQITMGWQKSEMIVLAARPGMGKTAMVICLANNLVKMYKKKVGIFSLEMSKEQLIERLFAVESEIEANIIKSAKKLTSEDYQKIGNIRNTILPYINIYDKSYLNIVNFRSIVRSMVANGAELIILDYIQLMKGTKEYYGNREAEISEISRGIKATAKEFKVPIIALAQVARETEKRGGNKEPLLSDLRESGAIEQDADVVMFIHRPEYYGIKNDEEGNSLEGLAKIIIAKHRNGALGKVLLRWEGKITKFTNYQIF